MIGQHQQRGLWFLSKKYYRHTGSIIMGMVTALPVLAMPVGAMQVKVSPANPHLGDTMTVVVGYDNPSVTSQPTVTVGQKTYQAFPIAANQFRAFVPTTPLEKAGTRQFQAQGGGESKSVAMMIGDRTFPVQHITLPPDKAGVDASVYEMKRVGELKALVTPQKFWNGPFIKPNSGPITTIYGVRRYYNGKFANDYYHRGVDYAGGTGSPIIAPAAGRVVLVGRVSQGFRIHGNCVGIDHGQGVTSIYLHMSQISVREGDVVKPGTVLGAVGSTGAATGPHLHWGLYVNGQSIDPVPWRTNGFN